MAPLLRRSRISRAGTLAAILVLTACSTLHRQARDRMKAGSYEEAVALYDRILLEDPKDSEAAAERAKAREKYIDQKLLVVRRSRVGGNLQNSVDLLLEIVTKENEWHSFPGGAVAYTQDEESAEALKYVGHLVHAALSRDLPLRGYVLTTRYAPIFSGPRTGAVEQLHAETKKVATKKCDRLASAASLENPY